jgi:hypothetical protein
VRTAVSVRVAAAKLASLPSSVARSIARPSGSSTCT